MADTVTLVRQGSLTIALMFASQLLAEESQGRKPAPPWKVARDQGEAVAYVQQSADGIVVRDVCFGERLHKPTLTVGCRKGQLRVLLAAGQMPSTDGQQRTKVLLLFDTDPGIEHMARLDPALPTLYFEETKPLVRELSSHNTLRVVFASRCSRSQELSFSLSGLSSVLGELASESCDVPGSSRLSVEDGSVITRASPFVIRALVNAPQDPPP